jgi:hypothetical protein
VIGGVDNSLHFPVLSMNSSFKPNLQHFRRFRLFKKSIFLSISISKHENDVILNPETSADVVVIMEP